MNSAEAENQIRSRIHVTPQRVVIAKAIILDAAKSTSGTNTLIAAVLQANACAIPVQVVIHESADTAGMITAAADAMSWQLAAREAIWSLIHGGQLYPLSETMGGDATRIGWTTVVPGSGGQSAGWTFEETRLPVPHQVRRSPSMSATKQFLSEPDLYLHSLGVTNMHADVSDAFAEAVRCFRAELFTAAFVMLGKASEGAWLELGRTLVKKVPAAGASRIAKQQTVLEDHNTGTMKKVEAVITVYAHQDLFGDVQDAAGVRPQRLKEVSVWSDAVRDSRNTIHFGVDATVPNTYEKLAALLIGAAPNVKTLYQVKAAAEQP